MKVVEFDVEVSEFGLNLCFEIDKFRELCVYDSTGFFSKFDIAFSFCLTAIHK